MPAVIGRQGQTQNNTPRRDIYFAPDKLASALAILARKNFQTHAPPPRMLIDGVLLVARCPQTEEAYFLNARELGNLAHYGIEYLRGGEPTPTPYQQRSECQRAETLLANFVAGVATAQPGERQNLLHKAAYSVGGIVGAGHLDFQTAFHQLVDAALECGLPQFEAQNTVRSGLKKGERRPMIFGPTNYQLDPRQKYLARINKKRRGLQ